MMIKEHVEVWSAFSLNPNTGYSASKFMFHLKYFQSLSSSLAKINGLFNPINKRHEKPFIGLPLAVKKFSYSLPSALLPWTSTSSYPLDDTCTRHMIFIFRTSYTFYSYRKAPTFLQKLTKPNLLAVYIAYPRRFTFIAHYWL